MEEPELLADFKASVTSGDVPLEVHFIDLSQGTHDCRWDFGDKTKTTSIKNPVHVFTEPGTYWVVLTITGINGNIEKRTKEIIVNHPSPVARFTARPESGKTPLKVQFTDLSETSGGDITDWYWTFGDGESSEDRNPVHEYTMSGNYTVSLKVTSEFSRMNTSTKKEYISVTRGLSVSFSADKSRGEFPLTVKFTSKRPPDVEIKSYYWDFEDGTSRGANPVHTFRTPGIYNVSLTLTNIYGESYTVKETKYITVEKPGQKVSSVTDNAEEPEPAVLTSDNEIKNIDPSNNTRDNTEIFGIPGTEFFRNETNRFNSLYMEWLSLIRDIFGF